VSPLLINEDANTLSIRTCPAAAGMEALVQMAGTSKGCGCLLVVDDHRTLLGTLSDGDLRRALTKSGQGVLALTVKAGRPRRSGAKWRQRI
jgi:CBS-domain-containing membrane protein